MGTKKKVAKVDVSDIGTTTTHRGSASARGTVSAAALPDVTIEQFDDGSYKLTQAGAPAGLLWVRAPFEYFGLYRGYCPTNNANNSVTITYDPVGYQTLADFKAAVLKADPNATFKTCTVTNGLPQT